MFWSYRLGAKTILSLWTVLFVVFCPSCISAKLYESDKNNDFCLSAKNAEITSIYIAPESTFRTKISAYQLKEYVEKISGISLQVSEASPNHIPERGIWIGDQNLIHEIFPDLKNKLTRPEEIVIRSNENHIVIYGRDRWNKEQISQKYNRIDSLTHYQTEYGTCNAIYTFIQDYLGVRWFFPGELGEDIPEKDSIVIPSLNFNYAPQIRARSGLFQYISKWRYEMPRGEEEEWLTHQRLFYSSQYFNGGHGFIDWWDRYSGTYPEIFALHEDGTRNLNLKKSIYAKMCFSNELIDSLWLIDVENQLIEFPDRTIFNALENDYYSAGHCVCENCQKLDSIGLDQDNPLLSDRYVVFANRIAKKLKEEYPGKEYYVLTGAYGWSRPAPVRAKPDSNVVVLNIANFHLQRANSLDSNFHANNFKDWAATESKQLWRPNFGNPVGIDWGLPDLELDQLFDEFEFVAENYCTGLYFWYHGHFATQGPQYYLASQLAWNPSIDQDSAMSDFYTRMYGPAHNTMQVYWENWQSKRNEVMQALKDDKFRRYQVHKYYTKEFLSQQEALLDTATQLLSDNHSKWRKRIEWNRSGLDYTKQVVRLRKLTRKYERGQGDAQALERNIDTAWDKIQSMRKNSRKNFALNPTYVFKPNLKKSKRLRGLHYTNLSTKKANKKALDVD